MIKLENLDIQLHIRPYHKYWKELRNQLEFQLWTQFGTQLRIQLEDQLKGALEDD